MRRVVVTGLGMLTPLGNGVEYQDDKQLIYIRYKKNT